jgi:hypothetical protein
MTPTPTMKGRKLSANKWVRKTKGGRLRVVQEEGAPKLIQTMTMV